MDKNKKLKTRDIANMTVEKYGAEIGKSCAEYGCCKSFDLMKDYVRSIIAEKYGKRMLKTLSAQFIGYSAHYIFAEMVDKYER